MFEVLCGEGVRGCGTWPLLTRGQLLLHHHQTGDAGAVGRFTTLPDGVMLDLKGEAPRCGFTNTWRMTTDSECGVVAAAGNRYLGKLVPCNTFMVVRVTGATAKVVCDDWWWC